MLITKTYKIELTSS